MKNKKFLTGLALASFLGAGMSMSFADFSGFGHSKTSLTQEEEASLSSMSDEEKKTFLEAKRDEFMEMKEAKEAVIDALLLGQTLTPEQETLRTQIIEERAQKKTQIQEAKKQMEEIKSIMEKKKSGQDLSDEEQAKLDNFKSDFKGGKKHKGDFHR